MVVKELITLVNVESNEILDEQLEYIQYINAAIDWLATILVSIKDREVVKNTDIPNLKSRTVRLYGVRSKEWLSYPHH